MRDKILVTAATLLLSGAGTALAGPEASDDTPLTREELVGLIDCSERDAYEKMFYIAVSEAPAWMRRNEEASGLSAYVYDLDRPIKVFGKDRRQIILYKDFVAVPLDDEEDVRHVVETQELKRAPIKATRQYYRFLNAEVGPMLSVFELAVNPFSMLLGGDSERLVYAGCTPALIDEQGFLDLAREADDLLLQMRAEIDAMFNEDDGSADPPSEP